MKIYKDFDGKSLKEGDKVNLMVFDDITPVMDKDGVITMHNNDKKLYIDCPPCNDILGQEQTESFLLEDVIKNFNSADQDWFIHKINLQ